MHIAPLSLNQTMYPPSLIIACNVHFWSDDVTFLDVRHMCSPRDLWTKGKFWNQNKTPPILSFSSLFVLLFLSFLLLNLQIVVEVLKSHASIKELTLKRRHGVQQYVFCLVISLAARKILAKRVRVRVLFWCFRKFEEKLENYFIKKLNEWHK